ncbi:hypothetical protein EMIT0158MI4_40254 [Burkholderia ambifaria]
MAGWGSPGNRMATGRFHHASVMRLFGDANQSSEQCIHEGELESDSTRRRDSALVQAIGSRS